MIVRVHLATALLSFPRETLTLGEVSCHLVRLTKLPDEEVQVVRNLNLLPRAMRLRHFGNRYFYSQPSLQVAVASLRFYKKATLRMGENIYKRSN